MSYPFLDDLAAACSYAESTCDEWRKRKKRQALEHVLVGRVLIKMRDEQKYPLGRFKNFLAWAEDRLECEEGQRNRLLAAGRITPERVEDKRIPLVKLAAIGNQPEWLEETLIDLAQADEARLAWIAASACKHLELHGDVDAARRHARDFAAKKVDALVPPPRVDSLEKLLERMQAPVKKLEKAASEVLARARGVPLPEGSVAATLLTAVVLGLVPVVVLFVMLARLVRIDLLALCAGRVPREAGDSPAGLKPEPEPELRPEEPRRPPMTTHAPPRRRRAQPRGNSEAEPEVAAAPEAAEEGEEAEAVEMTADEEREARYQAQAEDPELQKKAWQGLRDDNQNLIGFAPDVCGAWKVLPPSLREATEAVRPFFAVANFLDEEDVEHRVRHPFLDLVELQAD